MNNFMVGFLCFFAIFCGMLFFVFLGSQFSFYQSKKYPSHEHPKNKIIEASIFALMGLLIAFTFSEARERFDVRRMLVINEANAIKTAYLRLDLLPGNIQIITKKYLKDYLKIRMDIYKKMPHVDQVLPQLKQSEMLQNQIWNISVQFCQQNTAGGCIVLLPALNQMIDLANTRLEFTRIHPPAVILITLIVLALLSAALSGYSISSQSPWPSLHIISYAVIVSFTIFIIINLEYPDLSIIHIQYFNDVLLDVFQSM